MSKNFMSSFIQKCHVMKSHMTQGLALERETAFPCAGDFIESKNCHPLNPVSFLTHSVHLKLALPQAAQLSLKFI